MEQNLTNKEKLQILQNYQHFINDLKNSNETKVLIHLLFGGIFSTLTVICGLLFNPLAFRALLFSLSVCGVTESLFRFDRARSFKKVVTNKMSYKQFKKLQKSGEIAKWEQELNNSNIIVEEYQSKSYSLNSKEFAQRVVGAIQENNRNNSIDLEK